ncbi:hypothetical protein [Methanoculleus chikugoensis]|uniref:Uncharacterized protein n=1 Tax=Methanoculleus chikugoensis TaxID=118126 RepID=A0ABM7H4M2_9EURY|nr:hypothetical protein [Methanoculleus chikugoensis]BBL67706.1 hypothetical protein MchiMG62_08870 [Methanoculleus chikugoensis]
MLDGTGRREGIERKKGIDGAGVTRAVAAAWADIALPFAMNPIARSRPSSEVIEAQGRYAKFY